MRISTQCVRINNNVLELKLSCPITHLVGMTNKLMQLKRELHYKCEIGEKGEWECNGANEYLNRVFDVLDEYWQ